MASRIAVIVTAAGSSSRFNQGGSEKIKKEFVSLDGHSVLYRSCAPFFERKDVAAVFVTFKNGTREETRKALGELLEQRKIPVFLTEGGETRSSSVYNALKEIERLNNQLNVNYVAIHDGARPFVSQKLISDTVEAALETGGAIPVLEVTDTLIRRDKGMFVKECIARDGVCRVQTPQVFEFAKILKAYEVASKCASDHYTDDSGVFIDCKYQVKTVCGSEENIKITFTKDLK